MAQQQEPLLGRLPVEPRQESPKSQSVPVKRNPLPAATIIEDDTTESSGLDNAAKKNASIHVHSDPEPARSPDLVETVAERSSESPLATSKKSETAEDLSSSTRTTWLPYGLRLWFLIPMAVVAMGLAVVCIVLMVYSRSHYGLGTDDGQDSVIFGWRFSPTLVAVLYVLGTLIILNDVKRTEPYARLSSPGWSSARSTLCLAPGSWWDAYRRLFKPKDRRVSTPLLVATVLYTIGFLTISPLSASLLDSVNVAVRTPTTFEQVAGRRHLPLAFDPNEEVYLRTVAHVLQHLNTSAWITDEYAVQPFYPPSSSNAPLGPVLTDRSQQWSAATTVFKTAMSCEPMHVTETSSSLWRGDYQDHTYLSLNFSDSHGCDIRFLSEDGTGVGIQGYGGGSWFLAPNFTVVSWSAEAEPLLINITKPCQGQEIIFLSTPWSFKNPKPPQKNWTVAGPSMAPNTIIRSYMCDTKFYMVNITVLVSTSGSQLSSVSFDEEDFRRKQAEIPPEVFDTKLFQQTFVSANWSNFLYNAQYQDLNRPYPSTGGPLILLSGAYDLKFNRILHTPDLLSTANRLKQRFFGEMLMSAFTDLSTESGGTVAGELIVNQQRVVVNRPVAITLAVLLFSSGFLFLLMVWLSSPRRRPLNLCSDPSTLAAVGALTLHDPNTRCLFTGTEHLASEQIASTLTDTRHKLSNNDLSSLGQRKVLPSTSKRAHSWRPTAVKRRNGLCLLLCLCALLATIAALWQTYHGSGLYDITLLYQADIEVKHATFAFAPYSIVPTLLGVLIGLWWGSVEQTFRRIQPFISMTKRPTLMRDGPNLSYVSSYLFWGAWKAASHRHWILTLLCLGATFAEVFTVSMSALWQRQPGLTHEQALVQTQFVLRNRSQIFTVTPQGSPDQTDPVPGEVLASLYGTLETNWLYGATLQLAYNASEPPWSKDGWSFVPLNISTVKPASSSAQSMRSSSLADEELLLDAALVNVTVPTVATRARLECSPFGGFSNLSSWLTEVHLSNSSVWNVSANPKDLKNGFELGYTTWYANGYSIKNTAMELLSYGRRIQTNFFANQSPLQCCADNRTNEVKPAGIGYWSPQLSIDDNIIYSSQLGGTHGPNFTTKWIYGFPHPKLYYANTSVDETYTGHLIWRDVPQLTALNCRPVIETSTADVTVDQADGTVQSFKILEQPIPIGRPAWNDSFRELGLVSSSVTSPAGVATSFGFLFLNAMLQAADMTTVTTVETTSNIFGFEPIVDRTFNFRTPGLNMDFMTFAMYNLAGRNRIALLDPDVQARTANKAFSTFFQHFVSSNVTVQGTSVYEPVSNSMDVQATVTRRVEMLQMSLTATAICLSILGFFISTTIVVYFVDYKHFNNLQHDVESMADVLRLVCDSPKLLAWLSQNPSPSGKSAGKMGRMSSWRSVKWFSRVKTTEKGAYSKQNEPKVKLDMFKGTDGQMKWIVEIVDSPSE